MKQICNDCNYEYDGWQADHSKCIDNYRGSWPLFQDVPDDTFEKWEKLALKKCPHCNNNMNYNDDGWICYHKDCPLKPERYTKTRPKKRHEYRWSNEKQEWVCKTIDCDECLNLRK
ncbi:hypothetical protein LCGC14_0380620 [marine sediment metagenome]|uniref:Uncharacterized protein n=1 Tax=marine sediment metagenome TaxID=412755 RepID=A0A0F9VPQ5_9ZZZZ